MTMSTYHSLVLPLTLVMGLGAPFAASAQQPDPPPSAQSETGWRKFNDARAAEQASVVPAYRSDAGDGAGGHLDYDSGG